MIDKLLDKVEGMFDKVLNSIQNSTHVASYNSKTGELTYHAEFNNEGLINL